jgi:hypothetical protein
VKSYEKTTKKNKNERGEGQRKEIKDVFIKGEQVVAADNEVGGH